MTKVELAKEISQKTGIDKLETLKIMEAFMQTVRESMIKNETVFLRGFGTFVVRKRAAKIARNITKKTSMVLPAHCVPTFKPSKEFNKMIKMKKI